MSPWNIDTSEWPIVVHEVEGSLSNQQIDEFLQTASELLQRSDEYIAVMDASRIGTVSAYMRARITEWQRRHRADLNERCVGVAYVLTSPLLRFIAMTILLVTGLGVPYVVCASRDQALSWARQKLADREAQKGRGPTPPGSSS